MTRSKKLAYVIVIGAGPGGSVVAKICAQHGMRALLIEKDTIPRRKLCSGMLVSNLSKTLIAKEFGPIPEQVFTDPPYLKGYMWHTTGFGDERQVMEIENVWRSELDYWMNKKALEAGAEIWEATRVTDVIQENNEVKVKVRRSDGEQEICARFVVGADGATSVTRKALFPELKVRYTGVYNECHAGTLEIDREYWHIFGSARAAPSKDWFDVIHKRGCFIIDTNSRVRSCQESMMLAKHTLADKWGFILKSEPLWKDGTVVAYFRNDLYSGKFIPAKGNVLLVGDAAGVAVSTERGAAGEGINMALKSGLLAAGAIIKAANSSKQAGDLYLSEMSKLIEICKAIAADPVNYMINWTKREKLLNELC